MAKSIDYEEFVDIFAGELVKKIRSSDTKMAELFDEMSDITNETINRELQSMSNEKIAEIVTKATEDAQTEVKEIKQKLFCDSDIFFTQRVSDDVIKISERHYIIIPKKYNSLQETQAREMLPTQYRHLWATSRGVMIAIESMEDVHLYNAMRMLYNHFVERLSIGAQYGFDPTKVRKDVTELIKNKPVEMFEILEDMIAELDSRYKLGSRSLHPATSSVFDKIKFQVECFRKQYDVKSHIEVFVNPLPPPPERPRINTDETYARLKSEVTKHLANRFKNTITPPDAEVSVKNNLTKKEKKISAKQLKGKSRMHYLEIVTEDII